MNKKFELELVIEHNGHAVGTKITAINFLGKLPIYNLYLIECEFPDGSRSYVPRECVEVLNGMEHDLDLFLQKLPEGTLINSDNT